jgi:hypothetical protein
MPEQPFSNLLPSEDEITRIIVQTMQENPAQLPVILFRIELARFMVKAIDKFRESLIESIKQLEDTIYGDK